jgi:hypothetical protein
MSKIVKEISCIVGQYTNAQGEQKKRYQRIGSVIETKNGPMLKIDVIPLKEGGWDGWAYMNDPKPKEDRQAAPQQRGQAYGDGFPDDDIPDFN